jgi:hypothetical protein
MRNLLSTGDFRTGSVDVKVGNGAGTVATSTDLVGSWALNVDETDVGTNKYIRIRNIGVAAAVAASKVTEPPAEVIGDSLLLIDLESGPLRAPGVARTGFAQVTQVVNASPKALSNQIVELNFFAYSSVAGTFGVRIAKSNVYAGGTLAADILSEAVQLNAGWNRVRRVFLHPNVLDTDPIKGAYVSGSHTIYLEADQGDFSQVNINVNTTVAITGVFFGLQADAEFDRIEEILRTNTASSSLPTGGTVGQVVKKNSGTDFDASFTNILGSGTETTTTGAIAIDLTPGKEFDKVVLTGDPTFSTANRANGLFKSIRIDSNGADRTLAFNASWKWLGSDYSTGILLASGKIAVLSLTCYGTAETDIVAVYAAQP